MHSIEEGCFEMVISQTNQILGAANKHIEQGAWADFELLNLDAGFVARFPLRKNPEKPWVSMGGV